MEGGAKFFSQSQWTISEFQKPSLSKRGQLQNLSIDNEFDLPENKKIILI